jgi:hypothetical protein
MLPSFEEKSVWVQLVSLVVVLGGYFALSGVMLANGVRLLAPFVPVFIAATALLVIVMALGHVLAAFTGKIEKRDERDRLIGWRAESNSSWVLGSGVFFAMCALILGIEPVWVVHLLLASLFLSEVLKLALQLLYYKRGV